MAYPTDGCSCELKRTRLEEVTGLTFKNARYNGLSLIPKEATRHQFNVFFPRGGGAVVIILVSDLRGAHPPAVLAGSSPQKKNIKMYTEIY